MSINLQIYIYYVGKENKISMTKMLKKPVALLLAVFMVLSMFLPNFTNVFAADGDADYASTWPMSGAEYTAYTSRNAAQTALNNMKNGRAAGTTGIAKTTDNKNAVFIIKNNNESQTLTLPVNTNGDPYYVVETKVPAGWDLDEDIHEMKVVPGGQATTLTNGLVQSKELPDYFQLQLEKKVVMKTTVDTKEEYMAKYPISGAKFIATTDKAYAESIIEQIKALVGKTNYPKTITYDESKVATDMNGQKAIFTTNARGMTQQRWLDEDLTYYLVEVERPEGYLFSEDMIVESADSNKGNTVVLKSLSEGEITSWIRLDKSWSRNAEVQQINPKEYNLEITWGIYKQDGTTLVATGKTDKDTGAMIWNQNANDGKPAVELPLGTYIVKEIGVAPNSGKLWDEDNVVTVVLDDEDINTVDASTHFKNEPLDDQPTIDLVTKIESMEENQENILKIQGTKFKMYYIPDSTLNPATFTYLDSDGRKVLTEEIKNMATHEWIFEFKNADEIVSKTEEIWHIDDETGEQVFGEVTNYFRKNRIKYSDEFLEDGQSPLPKNEDDGTVMTYVGTYLFEEIESTRGFALSEPVYWQLKNNEDNTQFVDTDIRRFDMNAQTVVDEPKQGVKLIINKASEEEITEDFINTTLGGAQFKIEKYDPTLMTWVKANPIAKSLLTGDQEYIITTDSNGYAESYRMLPGTYRITEIKAPDGFTLEKIIFNGVEYAQGEPIELGNLSVENNGEYTFSYDRTLKNTPIKQPILKVSYNDEATLTPLAGATLQLIDLETNAVLKEWVTTEEAKVIKALTVGKTYRIAEVGVPEGYLMPMGTETYKDITIEDKEQQIQVEFLNEKIPVITSHATFSSGLKEQLDGTDAVLNDVFEIKDLLPNKSYTLKNIKLRNAADESVVASTEDYAFTTSSTKTTETVVFNFNTGGLSGGKYVITAELHRDDRQVVSQVQTHFDLTDWKESVVVPKIGTFAFDSTKDEESDFAKFLLNDTKGVVRDRIDYEQLLPETEYIAVTKLVDEEGNEVANSKTTFTTPSAEGPTVNGSAYVDIEVDSTKYNGHTLTVFEYVYRVNAKGEEVLIAKHEQLTDETQQVQIPEVKTTASETVITNEENEEDYWFELTDIVEYNHIPANTTFIGTATVMDPVTKETLKDENGNTFTSETEFVTDISGAGTYTVTFKIPYKLVEGKDIVMFEGIKTKDDNVDIAHHFEWEDQKQTVEFPEIHTTSWVVNKDEKDPGYNYRTKNIPQGTDIVDIVDVINVSNVKVGEELTLVGKVELVQPDGTVITLAYNDGEKYIVKETDGDKFELAMDFKEVGVSGLVTEGTKAVITEYLYKDNVLVGKHYQLLDEKQTLRMPDMGTNADDKSDADKYIYNNGKQVIRDIVTYTDLMPGVEVTLKTWLVDEEGHDLLDENGKKIEVVHTFTPETPNGEYKVEIEIDGKYFEGQALTVYEDLFEGTQLIGIHHDLSQETQTVYVPEVKTSASYNVIKEGNIVEITDVISYKHFPVEEMKGVITLVDLKTGKPMTNADGKEYKAEYTFTPTAEMGEIQIPVEIPVEEIREKKFVIFEEFYRIVKDTETDEPKEVPYAEHKDLTDKAQTIKLPEVGTTALDFDLKEHTGWANKKVKTVTDTVELKDVKPGYTYQLKAQLANVTESTEDKIVYLDIAPVIVEVTVPESSEKFVDYTTEVKIDVPVELIQNVKVVVFETLLDNGVELAFHAELTDKNQTVEYVTPEMGTTAVDKNTNKHTGFTNDKYVTIVDEVKMVGLGPNTEYTLEPSLADKTNSTNEKVAFITIANNTSYTFTTPEDLNPKDEYVVTIELKVLAKDVENKETVVFEALYHEGVRILTHEDINDEGQTVKYVTPEIGTVAELANTDTGLKQGITTIKDAVNYKGLMVGKEYQLVTKIVDKETGEFAKDSDGNEYVFTHKFTPEKADGTEVVTIEVKQADVNGKEIVIFEKLYVGYETEDEYEVAKHEDVNDKNQTIQLPLEVRVRIVKKSAGVEQYVLKGAKIAIFSDLDSENPIKDKYKNEAIGLTDENGEVVFEIFTEKGRTYYAKEIEAPLGYHINDKKFDITDKKFELIKNEDGTLETEMGIEILDNIIHIPGNPPQTGDNSNLALWIGLFLSSMLLGGIILVKRKRFPTR